MAWMLRLVKIGVEGEGPCTDIMEVHRPDDLSDIADLGLSLSEAKRLLARVQQVIVAGQVRDHSVQRPECLHCGRAWAWFKSGSHVELGEAGLTLPGRMMAP